MKGRDIVVSLERGFFILFLDSLFFLYSDYRSLIVVIVNVDLFVKFFVFRNFDGKYRNSKIENGSLSENNLNELRFVFIILFGVFDDFVESEFELKWKVDRREKFLFKSFIDWNNNLLGFLKEVKNFLEKLDDFVIIECFVDKVVDGSVYS